MSIDGALKHAREEAYPLLEELGAIEVQLVDVAQNFMRAVAAELANKGLSGVLAMDSDGAVFLFPVHPVADKAFGTWVAADGGESRHIKDTWLRLAKHAWIDSITMVGGYR